MSVESQKRRFHCGPAASGLPQSTDIIRPARLVRLVPICDIASERRGLVEGHPDRLPFAPDDVTRNVRAVRFKDKIKTIGDVAGVGNFERRPRNGNVAD